MRFDLHDSRFDAGNRNNLLHLLQGDVRQADRPAVAVVDKALQCPPCVR